MNPGNLGKCMFSEVDRRALHRKSLVERIPAYTSNLPKTFLFRYNNYSLSRKSGKLPRLFSQYSPSDIEYLNPSTLDIPSCTRLMRKYYPTVSNEHKKETVTHPVKRYVFISLDAVAIFRFAKRFSWIQLLQELDRLGD